MLNRKNFTSLLATAIVLLGAVPTTAMTKVELQPSIQRSQPMAGNTQSPAPANVQPAQTPVVGAPVLTAPDGTVLWGCVIDGSNFTNDYWTDPYGVYAFTPADSMTLTTVCKTSDLNANCGGVFYDGWFHYVTMRDAYGDTYFYHNAYDINSWDEDTWVHESLDDGYPYWALSCTYDATTSLSYGCYYTSQGKGMEIASLDYTTLTRKSIAPTDTMYLVFAADAKGQLYAISAGANLYKIDKTTGAATLVGPTGVDIGRYAQSGIINPRNGKFYWASQEKNYDANLYEVNLTTGAATLIGPIPYKSQLSALYIPAPEANDDAPAVVTNLTAAYNGTTTVVGFTAPAATFAGGELKGDLSYKVLVDGSEAATGTVAAGAAARVDVDAADGNRVFTVTTANAAGTSPKAKVEAWVGYDTPADPADVTLAVDGSNVAHLSWKAPTAGVHNGYLGKLTYRLTRYPGEVVVAESQTDTTFTETLPSAAMASYSYGVTALNGQQESLMTKSNAVVVGDGFDVPYAEYFDDQASFDLFTLLEGEETGLTWTWNSAGQYAQSTWGRAKAADQWLITPPVKLEAGHTYRFSASVAAQSASYVERFEAACGVAPTRAAMTEPLVAPTELTQGKTFKAYGNDFVPVTTGKYYFGIHAMSEAGMFRVLADSITVTHIMGPTGVTSVRSDVSTGDVEVFNLNGVRVSCGADALATLPKGVYILKYRDAARGRKIVVK